MFPATALMAAFRWWRQQKEQLGCWSIKALPPAFPSPLQPGPTVTVMAEAGMCSAWCQAPWRDGQPSEPHLWPEHPRMCCRMYPQPRKVCGEGWEVGGEEPKGQELALFSHPCKWQGGTQGKAASCSCLCHHLHVSLVSRPRAAFVIFCKSFAWQQGIPTSDSLTPLGSHSTEPLVPTATASWDPGCSQAMGASLGPVHTRGPFCPCPSTAGSGQNTATLSAPTGPAPAWPGVNCPATACPPQCSAGSRSPLPNTGGLCGAAGLNGGSVWLGMLGGREVEPLVSSLYLEVEIMARPGCRSGGTFMPALTGWRVPCCTRPEQPAACQRWGHSRDLAVLPSLHVPAQS